MMDNITSGYKNEQKNAYFGALVRHVLKRNAKTICRSKVSL